MRLALQWGLDIEFNFKNSSKNWSFGTFTKKEENDSLPPLSEHLKKDLGIKTEMPIRSDHQKFL
ncbi:hypothetical protein [Vibrio sonorensis]|uniref:hypothetical protein n=1 Tax=Vibrio sonorensis TaxID=1004316 RepID=UPI0008DAC7F4|nr:hypothetical protein [Vibrio sonorensis]